VTTPDIVVNRFVGESITFKCLDLRYLNIVWKIKNNFVQNKDLIKMSGMNASHLLSNVLTIKKLKISDSGSYKCYVNKKDKEHIVSIDLKVNIKINTALDEDGYDIIMPFLKKIIFLIALIALLLVLNIAKRDYTKNNLLKVMVERKKKDCYHIQKFLRINLEEYDKATLKINQ